MVYIIPDFDLNSVTNCETSVNKKMYHKVSTKFSLT